MSLSIDTDHDGRLMIRRWGDVIAGDKTEIWVEAHEIPDLLRDLTNAAMTALTHVARAMEEGDCETCGNTRLVEEPAPGGRTWSVHCPDCTAGRSRPEPFAEYPRIGGGMVPGPEPKP